MSVKNSYTTADYLEWDSMLTLIHRLYNDGDYRFSLLIGCGAFFGLRISDLRTLTWDKILDQDCFMLNEKKNREKTDNKDQQGFSETHPRLPRCIKRNIPQTALLLEQQRNSLFSSEDQRSFQRDQGEIRLED